CAVGTFVAVYCASHYRLGTLTALGPGMFPTALGVILALIGAAISGAALVSGGGAASVEVRPAFAVLASVAVFAASIRTLGLVPAIVLLTLVASTAKGTPQPKRVLMLAAALALIATLVFQVGLGLPVAIVR